MDYKLLEKHILQFNAYQQKNSELSRAEYNERLHSIKYYKSWSKEKIENMTKEDVYEYISKLWAMLIWGNKHYVVDKIIDDNGFGNLKKSIAKLVWGTEEIEKRWEDFRKNIKGMGPAMISEILCKTHPDKYMIWNRRAYFGLNQLGLKNLPIHNYQLTGKRYKELSEAAQNIAKVLKKFKIQDSTLLAVDYFIWREFPADNLTEVYSKKEKNEVEKEVLKANTEEALFIHNDVRDAIRDIGVWLGFNAEIEKKVADGSVVDAVWEASIGNMGRVMYVFEVQTKGSIDSLIINLLKAKNNPSVQAIVAVSDAKQIDKIKKHSASVPGLGEKLKYWDYKEVWKVHESMEFAYSAINKLKLVPDVF
jgi:hypothetical protein